MHSPMQKVYVGLEESMVILPNHEQTMPIHDYARSTPPAGWTVAK
jgi:hypothetical protein